MIQLDKKDEYLFKKYKFYIDMYGYVRAWDNESKEIIRLHRLIMDNPEQNIDHINGDRLDNRRSNLRLCNQSQNMANVGISKANRTGYKGVFWDEGRNRFRAYITFNRQRIELGRFSTSIEAARAYNNIAIQLFGEFARLNTVAKG